MNKKLAGLFSTLLLAASILTAILGIIFVSICRSEGYYSPDYRQSNSYKNLVRDIIRILEEESYSGASETVRDLYRSYPDMGRLVKDVNFYLERQEEDGAVVLTNKSGVGSLDEFAALNANTETSQWGMYYNNGQYSVFYDETSDNALSESTIDVLGDLITHRSINPDVIISFYVHSDLDRFGLLMQAKDKWEAGHWFVAVSIAAWVLCAFFTILLVMRYRDLEKSGKRVAKLMSRIPLELKILAILVGFILALNQMGYNDLWFFLALTLLAVMIYFLVCDVYYNASFGKKSVVYSIYNRLENKASSYPFQKRSGKRLLRFLITEAVLAIIAFFLAAVDAVSAVILLILPVMLLLALLYYRRNYRMLSTMGNAVDFVREVKKGNYSYELYASTQGELKGMCQDLLDIQAGLKDAVETQVKSERLKMELITNVSHDLKTPLTSIVSYVDLLCQMDLTPEPAGEYVRVLAQKASRLNTLMRDLFDVSKAASGTIEVDMVYLDIVALFRQTMAEMDAQIAGCSLDFRMALADSAIICGDGEKLNRVFENLISNILKYSLEGTRVYIETEKSSSEIKIIFKNISNYEMNFQVDQIFERFVRGDPSRSTEGSGLGLSIAKSFVEVQGGKLEIIVDGDLFKVEVSFALASESAVEQGMGQSKIPRLEIQ